MADQGQPPQSGQSCEQIITKVAPIKSTDVVTSPADTFFNTVSLPQTFCFTPPNLSQALTSVPQVAPGAHAPINIVGFPLNQLNQFVQQIPINQLTSTVQGFPLNQAIFSTSQGQFLHGACNQFPPLIMNPQQPIMTNALIGPSTSTGNINTVTPLSIISTPLNLPTVVESPANIETAREMETNKIVEIDSAKDSLQSICDSEVLAGDDDKSEIGSHLETVESECVVPETVPLNDSINLVENLDSETSKDGSDQIENDTTNTISISKENDCEITSNTDVEMVPSPQVDQFVDCEPPLVPNPPPCNAFQVEDEVTSEIMRRYRRNLNPKKRKATKSHPESESRKGDTIKKEYVSDNEEVIGVPEKKVFSSIDVGDYNEDGVPIEYDEPDFIWEDYLQESGTTAVPPTAFKHVECSLQSGFVKGMKLEVPNKTVSGTYWVASVVMTCGQLLRLRYDGYDEDGSSDFWCDLMTSEIHPIGWCSENNQTLQPPEAITDKVSDWKEFLMNSLTGARTAPTYLLDKTTGTTPIDQMKQGMKLELQDLDRPNQVWLVRIIENVGGRLYLRYEGIESGAMDFWLFYLDVRLHPIGWCKERNYTYKPPNILISSEYKMENLDKCLNEALEESKKQILPLDIFKDQKEVVRHEFEKGMKLEALHPVTRNQIFPATVVEIIDEYYFIVELDDVRGDREDKKVVQFAAFSNIPTIFPMHWCQWKGIKISFPSGYDKPEFNWSEYLNENEAVAAPESCFTLINEQDDDDHEFEKGMKLEAVNRENANQICAATITKIVGHLMWVHLDNSMRMVASHVEDVYSHNLFPVGWCESNGYQLKPPRKTRLNTTVSRRVAIVQPERPLRDSKEDCGMYAKIKRGETESDTWCPKIYFNHKCFSGPYLSKFRIAELPRCVGPGPIVLVMKEVLSMFINVAYKSCRVLRELQLEGQPNPSMHQQHLKAKYKTKSYRAVVEICKVSSQLEDFCRQVCIKLECCPNLISPHFIDDQCPENCAQLTKTKYTYYYGKKKKKVGRPPNSSTSIGDGNKKSKVKKKMTITAQRPDSPEGDDEDDKASVDSDSRTVDSTSTIESKHRSLLKPVKASMRLKRKYIHHLPPPSDMRTRGEKRPRYSFERRTHKKILISSPYNLLNQKTKSSQSLKTSHSKSSHHSFYHQKKDNYCVPQFKVKKEDILKLDQNPLDWSISHVVDFIKTTDCANVSRLFREQEIDGQALLLLTLPTVQEHLGLKLGPAIKLCHHIEKVKIAFYHNYAK